MAGTTFTSFEGVATYLEVSAKRLGSARKDTLKAIGLFLKQSIQDKYGRQQPGWPKSKNPTPLYKTGKLKGAVYYQTHTDWVEVGSKKEWLAVIHEYGVTFRMTDKQRKYLFAVVFKDAAPKTGRPRTTHKGFIVIPARPIWRVILREKQGNIAAIYSSFLNTVFQ